MPRERLQLLRKVCGQSHEDGLWKMCQLWLDFEPELTWDRVLEALRGREMGSHGAEVARDIGRKLCPDFSPGGGSVRTSTNSDKSITMVSNHFTTLSYCHCPNHSSDGYIIAAQKNREPQLPFIYVHVL